MTQRPNETWEEFCRRCDGLGDARFPDQPGSIGFAPYAPPNDGVERDANGCIVRKSK